MKFPLVILSFLICVAHPLWSAEKVTLIFADNFNRNESNEAVEEVGNGWTTNSAGRAGGHKQADLKDGALDIRRHAEADHSVTLFHPAEFRDGVIELRFMLENKDDGLIVDLADPLCKEVHAGHLLAVVILPDRITFQDRKTGNMDLQLFELRKAKQTTPEQDALLLTKSKRINHALDLGKWHTLRFEIKAETETCFIDGEEVGSFSSSGIAHPTKRELRLAVEKHIIIDDLKVYALSLF